MHVRRDSALKFHTRAVKASPYDADICFNFALFQVRNRTRHALPKHVMFSFGSYA